VKNENKDRLRKRMPSLGVPLEKNAMSSLQNSTTTFMTCYANLVLEMLFCLPSEVCKAFSCLLSLLACFYSLFFQYYFSGY